MSKRRLHQQLRKGNVDFYPNGSFSSSRAEYVNYIDMGLMSGEFGLTEVSFLGDIGHYKELRQQNLIWLMEKGGSKEEFAEKFNVKTQRLKYVDIDIARVEFIKGTSHFYVVDNEVIDYYLYQNKVDSLTGLGLKLHRNCCGGERPMYAIFSQSSAYYQGEKNPDFDDSKPLGPANQPTRPAHDSVAAKLANALKEMSESGESDKIYRRNYYP